MSDDQISERKNPSESVSSEVSKGAIKYLKSDAIVCPVCGAKAVQEKCKVICRSEVCHGRIIMNCSEF
jgi:hypothetical protein